MYPGAFLTSSLNRQYGDDDCDIVEHMCAGVTHPVTVETITKYKKLVAMPEFTETWGTAFGKEFGIVYVRDKFYKELRIILFCDLQGVEGFSRTGQ